MLASIEIRGAEQFAELGKRLKGADKETKREFFSAINRSAKPLKSDAKASAESVLPSRGGLGKRVARTRITTRRRMGGRNPGVSIVANPGAVNDPGRIDRGRIKHPVFGRGPWVLQDVMPGWFTKPMQAGAAKVRRELIKAMDDITERLAK